MRYYILIKTYVQNVISLIFNVSTENTPLTPLIQIYSYIHKVPLCLKYIQDNRID